MSDLVREHPNRPFEQIYRKHIGEFENSLEGRSLARACEKVFEQVRRGTNDHPMPDKSAKWMAVSSKCVRLYHPTARNMLPSN